MPYTGQCRSRAPYEANRTGDFLQRGFTLVEILVVLVIIGLFVGLISTVARPDDRALLRMETERLAQLLDLAATESRLAGRRIAWTSDGPTYRFWRFSADSGWSEIRDVDSLRPRTLPQGITIASVRLENGPPAERMRLEFAPTGSTRSFTVDLRFGEFHQVVEGSPVGRILAAPASQPDPDKVLPAR